MKKKYNQLRSFIPIFGKVILLMWETSKLSLILMFILSVLSGCINTGTLVISKYFVDNLTNTLILQKWSWQPVIWLFIILIVAISNSIVSNFRQYVGDNFTENLSLHISDMILSKTVNLEMKNFDNEVTYNKIKTAADETPDRCIVIISVIESLVVGFIQLMGAFAILLSIDWFIVVISFITSIPLFYLSCYISEFWFKISIGRVEKLRLADALKQILLKNDYIKELKLFQISKYLKDVLLKQQKSFNLENSKTRKKFAIINNLDTGLNNIISFLLKIWIILKAIRNKLSIGSVSMYIAAVDTFQNSVINILQQFSSGYEQLLYLSYIFEIDKMEEEEASNLIDMDEPIKKIEFKNVSFCYPGTDNLVLDNVSFVIKSEKTYAIVGVNGTGKTTLIKLILRLYLPTAGTILINDKDIKEISPISIRRQITSVFQDYIKYPFTVKENISLSDISSANNYTKIIASSLATCANEFINNLPKKYNTQLQREWKEGIELSGGQWQKIAISRCLFKEANIMILDEPFSAIDVLSEKKIIEYIRKAKQNKICLFVTHRYTSIQLADYIFVFEKGRVVESGTHSYLISQNNLYSNLINAQIILDK